MEKNLVLLSGGGFSTETDSYIDNFALSLCANKEKKEVVFIPTASHDSDGYIEKFNQAFKEHHAYALKKEDLIGNDILEQADLIYIGGGDELYLIETWRELGFDLKMIDLYNQGKVIVGISAGAMCWFSHVFSDGQVDHGLGILEGSFFPHYDELNAERQAYENWTSVNPQIKHYKLNNSDSLHVKNDRIVAKITTTN